MNYSTSDFKKFSQKKDVSNVAAYLMKSYWFKHMVQQIWSN